MNAPWPPPQQCTCGCEPCVCECEPCPPTIDAGQIKECWKEVSAFKKMLEEMLTQMGFSPGTTGPAGAQGVAGPSGPAGAQGPAGMSITYTGATQPAGGSNGELWLNTSDKSLWVYEDLTGWIDVSAGGAGVVGPQGPQGPAGPQGPQGPAGAQGTPGTAGAPGATGADGGASLTLGAVGTYGLMSALVGSNGTQLLAIGAQIANPPMLGNRTGTWQVVNYGMDHDLLSSGTGGVATYLMQRIS